jgi:hypothetical protein
MAWTFHAPSRISEGIDDDRPYSDRISGLFGQRNARSQTLRRPVCFPSWGWAGAGECARRGWPAPEQMIEPVDASDPRMGVVDHPRGKAFHLLAIPDWMGPTQACEARLERGDVATIEEGAERGSATTTSPRCASRTRTIRGRCSRWDGHVTPAPSASSRSRSSSPDPRPLLPAPGAPEPRESPREPSTPQERRELLLDELRRPLPVAQPRRLRPERLVMVAHHLIQHRRGWVARGICARREGHAPARSESRGGIRRARFRGRSRATTLQIAIDDRKH